MVDQQMEPKIASESDKLNKEIPIAEESSTNNTENERANDKETVKELDEEDEIIEDLHNNSTESDDKDNTTTEIDKDHLEAEETLTGDQIVNMKVDEDNCEIVDRKMEQNIYSESDKLNKEIPIPVESSTDNIENEGANSENDEKIIKKEDEEHEILEDLHNTTTESDDEDNLEKMEVDEDNMEENFQEPGEKVDKKIEHDVLNEEINNQTVLTNDIRDENRQKKFVCIVCNTETNKDYLRNHVLSHFYDEFDQFIPQEEPFDCPDCQRTFKDRSNLIRHYSWGHGHFEKVTGLSKDVTEISKMSVGTKNDGNVHVDVEEDNKSFINARFIKDEAKNSSDAHIDNKKRQKTKTKASRKMPLQNYVCVVCNVETNKDYLRNHVLSHFYDKFDPFISQEEPFDCPDCSKTFNHRSILIRHYSWGHGHFEKVTGLSKDVTELGKMSVHIKNDGDENVDGTMGSSKNEKEMRKSVLNRSDRRSKAIMLNQNASILFSKTNPKLNPTFTNACPIKVEAKNGGDVHIDNEEIVDETKELRKMSVQISVCVVCNVECKDKSYLRYHILSHFYDKFDPFVPQEKPFDCPDCGKTFKTKINLICHYSWRHGYFKKVTGLSKDVLNLSKMSVDNDEYIEGAKGDEYSCVVCKIGCESTKSLKKHILSHFYKDFDPFIPKEKPYACPDCGKTNINKITLIRHYSWAHGHFEKVTGLSKDVIVQEREIGKGFCCVVCNVECTYKGNLRHHILSHFYNKFDPFIPQKKPFDCPDCGKTSTYKTTLIRHFAYIHGHFEEITGLSKDVIELRKISVPTNNDSDVHVDNKEYVEETTVGRYSCVVCKTRCKTMQFLKRHILSHFYKKFDPYLPQEIPFACPDCGKTKPRKSDLIRHYAWTHQRFEQVTGLTEDVILKKEIVEGYNCIVCNMECKDMANLRKHILSHFYEKFDHFIPQEKPFACPECGNISRDKYWLIHHYAFTHQYFEIVTGMSINDIGLRKKSVQDSEMKNEEHGEQFIQDNESSEDHYQSLFKRKRKGEPIELYKEKMIKTEEPIEIKNEEDSDENVDAQDSIPRTMDISKNQKIMRKTVMYRSGRKSRAIVSNQNAPILFSSINPLPNPMIQRSDQRTSTITSLVNSPKKIQKKTSSISSDNMLNGNTPKLLSKMMSLPEFSITPHNTIVSPKKTLKLPFKNLPKTTKSMVPSKVKEVVYAPGSNALICWECQKVFTNKLEHDKHSHGDLVDVVDESQKNESMTLKTDKPLMENCQICKKLIDINDMSNHVRSHQIQCQKCSFTSMNRLGLEFHMKSEHTIQCKSKKVFNTNEELKKNQSLKCDSCPFISSTKDSLMRHNKMNHQGCTKCEDEFSWPEPEHSCYYTVNNIHPPVSTN